VNFKISPERKRVVKRVMAVLLLIVSLYLVVAPFVPELQFRVKKLLMRNEENAGLERLMQIEENDGGEGEIEVPDENRLVIPAIDVDVKIVEGYSDEVLTLGAWRRPNSSTPDAGGNTVITGHRFHYLPPNNKTFYNLDKLGKGDKLVVFWKKGRYVYTVSEIFEVTPDQVEIESNTEESVLTLYTCTPLWTSSKRLVVRANLDLIDNNNHED